jgi:hypothetical protein
VVDDPPHGAGLFKSATLGRRCRGKSSECIVAKNVAVESDHRPSSISALEEAHRHDAFTDNVAHEISHRPFVTRGHLQQLVRRDGEEPTLEFGTGVTE